MSCIFLASVTVSLGATGRIGSPGAPCGAGGGVDIPGIIAAHGGGTGVTGTLIRANQEPYVHQVRRPPGRGAQFPAQAPIASGIAQFILDLSPYLGIMPLPS